MQQPTQLQGGAGSGPPHYLSDAPLPFKKIFYGSAQYQEFVCSKETGDWLKNGGMTHLDGKKVTLVVKDECVGGHNVVMGILTQQDQP